MMDVKVVIGLIVLLIVKLQVSAGDAGLPCAAVADVVVVFEVPAGNSAVVYEIQDFFRQLRNVLNPSLSCIRLGLILASTEVKTIVKLDCSYKSSKCGNIPDIYLPALGRTFPKTAEFNKYNLVEAIDSANIMLFSEELGARKQLAPNKDVIPVKKVCLLILNSPPKENVIPTEDAVKDLHDRSVVVIAVGVNDGRQEKLKEIVMISNYDVNVESMKELSSTLKIKQLENLVTRDYEEFPEVSTYTDFKFGPPEAIKAPAILAVDLQQQCDYIVDIGFLVDSSGSLRREYGKEKTFVKRIATKFKVSEAGSHAGVIIFSARNYVNTVINFKQTTLIDFIDAVEQMPYYGYYTRIDLALDKAHKELFTLKDGSRPNVRKVLFLITDGNQNPKVENNVLLDPAKEAAPLHNNGINIFAVGIGEKINFGELELITRSKERVYSVKNFDELISNEFVKKVSEELCQGATLSEETTTSAPITTPQPQRKTTPTTRATTRPTTSKPKLKTARAPAPEPCKKDCSSCGECSSGCCSGCCNQKPDVYINVFSGSNSKNYISQGMNVKQSGNHAVSSGVNSPKSDESGATVKQNTKGMSANEISALIKECLPYQNTMNKGIQELLRRSIKAQTNNPNIQKRRKK